MCEACLPAGLLSPPPVLPAKPSRYPAHAGRHRQVTKSSGTDGRRRHRAGTADLIITGGPVLTMDPLGTRPEAVAVRGGRIAAVGSRDEISSLQDRETEFVDLDGRTLLPGLIDPHMHAAMTMMSDWLDVSAMVTPDENAVFAAVRTATPMANGWVFARGFDPTITAGHPLVDRDVLDRLVPDRPVFVVESNLHVGYANSAALRAVGVDRSTPDPPMARFVRGVDGEPTGRVEEAAALATFMRNVPRPNAENVLARHRDLLWHAASKGVTLLHDCGIGLAGGTADLDVLRNVVDAGSPVRYRGMLVSTLYDQWIDAGLRPGLGTDLFRVDGIKAWSDGSNQGGTGFLREPYLGTPDRGSLNYSPEQLTAVIDRAHRDGWQIGVHANGDAAIDVTIDAYEQALAANPRPDHRHRIEHASILEDDHIERMATLGLSPSFLIGHIRWWGMAFRDRLLGADRANHYDPCASALAGGLRISLHSDWNVTPLEPLRYVQDAVTRIMTQSGEVLNPDECIDAEAALRAVTIDAAWQCRADDITGSIEVGKYADLTILEEDPTQVDPSRIETITVSQTRLGGEVRYSS